MYTLWAPPSERPGCTCVPSTRTCLSLFRRSTLGSVGLGGPWRRAQEQWGWVSEVLEALKGSRSTLCGPTVHIPEATSASTAGRAPLAECQHTAQKELCEVFLGLRSSPVRLFPF